MINSSHNITFEFFRSHNFSTKTCESKYIYTFLYKFPRRRIRDRFTRRGSEFSKNGRKFAEKGDRFKIRRRPTRLSQLAASTSAGPRGPSTVLETFALKNGRRRQTVFRSSRITAAHSLEQRGNIHRKLPFPGDRSRRNSPRERI